MRSLIGDLCLGLNFDRTMAFQGRRRVGRCDKSMIDQSQSRIGSLTAIRMIHWEYRLVIEMDLNRADVRVDLRWPWKAIGQDAHLAHALMKNCTVRSMIASREGSISASTFLQLWPEFLMIMISTGASTVSAFCFM